MKQSIAQLIDELSVEEVMVFGKWYKQFLVKMFGTPSAAPPQSGLGGTPKVADTHFRNGINFIEKER